VIVVSDDSNPSAVDVSSSFSRSFSSWLSLSLSLRFLRLASVPFSLLLAVKAGGGVQLEIQVLRRRHLLVNTRREKLLLVPVAVKQLEFVGATDLPNDIVHRQ